MRAKEILPEGWSEKYKRSIDCSRPKGFSQRAHCQGRKKDEDQHPNEKPRGPETKPTMPQGTVRVDVSDVYDWYKLGQHISNMKGLGKHDFGKGPPSTILSFGSEDEEHQFIQALKQIGLDITDIDPAYHDKKKGIKTDPTYNVGEAVVDLGETRQGAFNWLKSYLPTWPDYVLRDWLYRGLTKHDPNENPKEVIDRILASEGMSTKTQWKLIPNFEFKIEKLHPDTQRRIKIRAGGSANPMNVPKDAERHATQAALAKKQGGVRKEPVIGKMTSQGFELIEGWHRTIQHFNQFPKGYNGPAWVAMNATAESIDENFADGKVKGKSRPGRVKKAGASCKGSVTSLRQKAKKYGGERGKMYHWCANMKGGKK